MNEILNTEDVVFAEGLFNDGVVGKGNALLVDLAVAALVDQLPDGFNIRLAAERVNIAAFTTLSTNPYVM